MNIKRAKEEIKNTIEAYLWKDSYGNYEIPSVRQRPVLLMGPPGVGKTQIMEQISREMEIGLVSYTITHHTRQSAIGLPYIVERQYGGRKMSVTEYTMSEIVASVYRKIEKTGLREGILFIDEINCVSETLAPAMLQFLQCKTFGSHEIPQGWIIVAAGNPPEYNKSVREFDVVTLDRIKMIPVEPDYQIWKEYAYEQAIHPAVISYLNTRPQSFCQIETTVDGKRFVTPRGWEDLSAFLQVYEELGKKADRDVVGQYLQYPKIAKDFANYLELFYKYQDDWQVDEILSGTIRESLCRRAANAPFDEKLSMIGLLLSRISREFVKAVNQAEKAELLMKWLKGFSREFGEEKSMRAGLAVFIEEKGKERENREEGGLLDKRQDLVWRTALEALGDYEKGVERENLTENTRVWNRLKEFFDEENQEYERLVEQGGQCLERAFDFMEAAFGDSQEMVLFVTELNTSQDALRFLKEYECQRYYQYNERLLFTHQEDAIKERIDRLNR